MKKAAASRATRAAGKSPKVSTTVAEQGSKYVPVISQRVHHCSFFFISLFYIAPIGLLTAYLAWRYYASTYAV